MPKLVLSPKAKKTLIFSTKTQPILHFNKPATAPYDKQNSIADNNICPTCKTKLS